MKRIRTDCWIDQGVRGYIYNTARDNYWRVMRWYELDDLIQDGFLVAMKCERRFEPKGPTIKDSQRQFMAYFAGAFQRHIIDLANAKTEAAAELLVAEDFDWDSAKGARTDETASLSGWIAKAPQEVREVLHKIIVEGKASGPFLRSNLVKICLPSGGVRIIYTSRPVRETTDDYYFRCLGRRGVVKLLQDYFLGDDPVVPTTK